MTSITPRKDDLSGGDRVAADVTTSDGDTISLIDVVEFLQKSIPTVVVSVAMTSLLALFYLYTATPMYRASAVLIIHGSGQATVNLIDLNGLSPINDRHMQGQIEIIRSPRTARKVVKEIGIANLSYPLFVDSTLSKSEKTNRTARKVLGSVGIKIVNQSNVVQLTTNWDSPKMAAKIANAMAEAYLDDSSEERVRKAHKARDWLNQRIIEIQKELRKAAYELQERRSRRDYRIQDGSRPESGAETNQVISKAKVSPGFNVPPGIKGKLSLDELNSRKNTYQRMYETYLRAYSDSIHKQLYPKSIARIVSRAVPPSGKSSPKSKLTMVLAIVMGIAIGLLVSLLRIALQSEYSKRAGVAVK